MSSVESMKKHPLFNVLLSPKQAVGRKDSRKQKGRPISSSNQNGGGGGGGKSKKKEKTIARKEKKATQTLAIVLGEILLMRYTTFVIWVENIYSDKRRPRKTQHIL
jgi:hypothetical protein